MEMKGRWNKTLNNKRQIKKGEKGDKENIGGEKRGRKKIERKKEKFSPREHWKL